MRWFELAKVGKYTDRFGQLVDLTKEKLRACASSYKPDMYQAPITVGHPESQKEPAWGRVAALKFDEATETLLFKPARLVAEFAEMVNKGMYTHVSAAFNSDNYSLNHVAFLGAKPPAIKGMKEVMAVEFASAPDHLVTTDCSDVVKPWIGRVEFSAERDSWILWQIKTLGRIARRLRDHVLERDGAEKANAIVAEWEIEQLVSEPPQEQIETTTTQFSTPKEPGMNLTLEQQVSDLTSKVTELSAKVTTLESEKTELQTKLTTAETENSTLKAAAKRKEFSEFCDGRI